MLIKTENKTIFKNQGTIFDKTFFFFYYFNYIKPELKINLLKKEIFKNIPKIIIDNKDLYIYMRSGDIFEKKRPLYYYAQPPLCFYKKIIQNYKFKNNYISK